MLIVVVFLLLLLEFTYYYLVGLMVGADIDWIYVGVAYVLVALPVGLEFDYCCGFAGFDLLGCLGGDLLQV